MMKFCGRKKRRSLQAYIYDISEDHHRVFTHCLFDYYRLSTWEANMFKDCRMHWMLLELEESLDHLRSTCREAASSTREDMLYHLVYIVVMVILIRRGLVGTG